MVCSECDRKSCPARGPMALAQKQNSSTLRRELRRVAYHTAACNAPMNLARKLEGKAPIYWVSHRNTAVCSEG